MSNNKNKLKIRKINLLYWILLTIVFSLLVVYMVKPFSKAKENTQETDTSDQYSTELEIAQNEEIMNQSVAQQSLDDEIENEEMMNQGVALQSLDDEIEDEQEKIEPTVIYVNYSAQTINGVSYAAGNNTKDGLTPQTAVKTLAQAYKMLDENKSREEQYIVIMGTYDAVKDTTYISYNESNTAGYVSSIYTKPATITGAYGNVNYGAVLTLIPGISAGENDKNKSNYIYADTTFENIKLNGTGSVFLFCQGRNLTMGEGIVTETPTISAASAGTGVIAGLRPQFQVFAGWQSYKNHVKQKDEPTEIVIKSGTYERIVLANRLGVARAKNQMSFTKEKPFNVKLTIDIQSSSKTYAYDINTLYGGNGEGSVYMNSEIDFKNGSIGRFLGGSRGNDVDERGQTIPGNTFFGSTVLNMSGGSIYEFFAASLGSARASSTTGSTPYQGYSGNYQFGKVTVNISGGTIGYSKVSSERKALYGGAGGAVVGYSADSSYPWKSFVINQTMPDMNGNTIKLDEMETTINITGGTIYGNIFGGGYGWSDSLESKQFPTDGGFTYGSININISDKDNQTIIKGNIYGGGNGNDAHGSVRPNLASVVGDIKINISGSPTIDGNIYGGGNGSSTYKEMAKVTGNVEVQVSDNANIKGNIYGAGAKSKLVGNAKVIINGITHTQKIFGGGDFGLVDGNTEVKISSGKLENVYAGGYSGNINGKTTINISNATIQEVYGGGYSGSVGNQSNTIAEDGSATSNVTINSGTIGNVFGGGNLGDVYGNTEVIVGTDDETTSTIITGIVYGGGRGESAASETVSKNSNVRIQGMGTKVENYGSIKLGSVAGDVFLTFKNYRIKNPTSRYKRMNGIDRATTVTFDNSYVLLENKSTQIINGKEEEVLEGIKAIENIILPYGSGLKISADGEITGNFEGGGELYLDSKICLTVGGNLTIGQDDNGNPRPTSLVLNPKLEDSSHQIVGGIEQPYMIVKGENENTEINVEKDATRLVSGETKYVILTQKKDDNKAYYYIDGTIEITNYIEDNYINIADRVYFSNIENENDIKILNNSTFTNSAKIHYVFYQDDAENNKFRNISSKISITDESLEPKPIPIGTTITMVKDGKLYYYTVDKSNVTEIDLAKFVNYDNNTNYNNTFDITQIPDEFKNHNIISNVTSYNYEEEYRFIVDYSKCENENRMSYGQYCVKMYFKDNGNALEENEIGNTKTNMINISERNYEISVTDKKDLYKTNDNIEIKADLKISSTDAKWQDQYLDASVKLLDSNNTEIKLPEGAKLIVNGNIFDNNNIRLLPQKVTSSSVNVKDLKLSIDMSNVIQSEKLDAGEYKIVLDLRLSYNKIQDLSTINKIIIPINIIDYKNDEFGIKATLDNSNSLDKDKIQLIELGKESVRNINIEYSGSLSDVYIKCEGVEQTQPFTFNKTTNTENNIIFDKTQITNLDSNNSVKVTFKSDLSSGTYRTKFTLCDRYGYELTSDFVNFIVP